MSATGLDVFDKTLQTTHIWLDEIMGDLGPDRQIAWKALQASLHALRDRLQPEQAVHFGAQLPLLVRGLYYDQWHPADKPDKSRTQEEFLGRVAEELQGVRPVNPETAARAVFKVATGHVSPGQVEKVKQALPTRIRTLWPDGSDPDPEASPSSGD